MNPTKYQLPFIIPSTEDVIRRLQYNPNKTIIEQDIINLIKSILIETSDLIHPIGLSLDFSPIIIEKDYIILEKNNKIYSSKLAGIMKNSKIISLIVATIGEEISIEIEENMKKENYSRAVIIDAIASEAVESFVEHIQKTLLSNKRLMGLKPTMRFSPGYGDLSIENQPYFLKLIEAEKIGISLHPKSFLLIPEKTITALVGWES